MCAHVCVCVRMCVCMSSEFIPFSFKIHHQLLGHAPLPGELFLKKENYHCGTGE